MFGIQKSANIIEYERDVEQLFAGDDPLNGFQVVKINRRTAAMTLLTEEKPDVIIPDVTRADVSRREVLGSIRREQEASSTPGVMVSARAETTDLRTCMKAGASDKRMRRVRLTDLKFAVDRLTQSV